MKFTEYQIEKKVKIQTVLFLPQEGLKSIFPVFCRP